ncbi:hypothetical protein B296_00017909 [Ensete ventricosum]|uniref:BSD domain-containing protein n=1 Tax=Ensete ventricosum TaxID=4639 RepID=A0A427A5W0_ENSVE|nr:hypothetical protein B296_00017909 [Ensete ventricosum]
MHTVGPTLWTRAIRSHYTARSLRSLTSIHHSCSPRTSPSPLGSIRNPRANKASAMDFFKSVFSDDPDPAISQHSPVGSPHDEEDRAGEDDRGSSGSPSPNSEASAGGVGWSFGGFIKTFASKSESVIQTYRRDLAEFGTGLKKETEAIREAAARAVRDLPVSLEAGASVAQESLESVGQAIDDLGGSVWRGTAEIVSQGKDAILSMEAGADSADQHSIEPGRPSSSSSSRRYTRFEVQVLAIQSDARTFSEDPEDAEAFSEWRSGFDLAEKEEEIENLCYENGAMDGLLNNLVPGVVDYETFWCRYYYRVHKLKQAEDARAMLVKRVISREEEEEELSWEVDDDDGEEEETKQEEKKEQDLNSKRHVIEVEKQEQQNNEELRSIMETAAEQNPADATQVENLGALEAKVDDGKASTAGYPENTESTVGHLTCKLDETLVVEGKAAAGGSSKDSDFSVISSQNSTPEEDDLGWDEIEDLGEHDETKAGGSSGSPVKVDLHKRLSAAEEDEDLSWDIEDDDEPSKS